MSHITRAELSRDNAARAALTTLLRDQSGTDNGHRLVWTLFADDPDASRDFVFREAAPGRYLIVSARAPSDTHGLWQMDTKAYVPALQVGQRLGFTLRANPTTAIKQQDSKRGKRVDVIMHAKTKATESLDAEVIEQVALDWLLTREEALGVHFARDLCSAAGYRQIRIPRERAKPICLSVIDYEGVLKVTDTDLLTRALMQGVGKARAYGCGLLLLRPLSG